MTVRVFQTFGGQGVGIESEKGCVKFTWDECPMIAQKIMLLAQAKAMTVSVYKHNDEVAPLPMITVDPEEYRQ